MSPASPSWTDGILARHHAKRARAHAGSIEDVLGITGRSMTAEEDRDRSAQAVAGAW
jgi:hypothetical protein